MSINLVNLHLVTTKVKKKLWAKAFNKEKIKKLISEVIKQIKNQFLIYKIVKKIFKGILFLSEQKVIKFLIKSMIILWKK